MEDQEELETRNDGGGEISFAEQEFINWCGANEINCNEAAMDADDRKDFLKMKRHFTAAVEEKRLAVDGENLIYTVSGRSKKLAGTKITVGRPNGRAMLAMDGYKETQQVNKLQAFMAAIAGIKKYDIANISDLDAKDYQLIQDIAILFLTT